MLPNESSGNLEHLFDVKSEPDSFVVEKIDTNQEQTTSTMSESKKQLDIAQELLRMDQKLSLFKSLENKQDVMSSTAEIAEIDKYNRAFFETLLPTMREVKKEDILMCRNDVSRVVYQYAYKNSSWKSLNETQSVPKAMPATATAPASLKRKRVVETVVEDDGKNSYLNIYKTQTLYVRL